MRRFIQLNILSFILIHSLSFAGENRATTNILLTEEGSQVLSNASIGIDDNTNVGDTLIIFFEADEVLEPDGEDAVVDTFKVDVVFRTHHNATASNLRVIRPLKDDTTLSVVASENYTVGKISFVENTVDSIKIIVESGSRLMLSANGIRANNTVITDIKKNLFGDGGASIINPVTNGFLTIDLPADVSFAQVDLVSLQGELITSKSITSTDNSLDVSQLSGVYILREQSTGSFKKIIIQ